MARRKSVKAKSKPYYSIYIGAGILAYSLAAVLFHLPSSPPEIDSEMTRRIPTQPPLVMDQISPERVPAGAPSEGPAANGTDTPASEPPEASAVSEEAFFEKRPETRPFFVKKRGGVITHDFTKSNERYHLKCTG